MAARKQAGMAATNLMNRTERHELEFEGLTINLEVAPRKFTPALETAMQAAGTHTEGVVLMVSRLVTGWDLLDDDGPEAQPYPLTEEALSELPMPFLAAVAEKLGDVLGPKRKSATTSAGSS